MSSSALANSQFRIDSSCPDHELGGAGKFPRDGMFDGPLSLVEKLEFRPGGAGNLFMLPSGALKNEGKCRGDSGGEYLL